MLGYIIGLGDRHLDNVLVDMKTSEFVHIDYNVCFEKGARFKIPETVPFRLTQNLVHATEMSLFRNSGSDALNILKANSETLLTLLDAFLYDPIFDWTLDIQEEQYELARKKNDEKAAINRVIFASRWAEIRFSWNDNRIKLISGLKKLSEKKNELERSRIATGAISMKLDSVRLKYGQVLSDIRSKNYNQIIEKFSIFKNLKYEVFTIQAKITSLVETCEHVTKCSDDISKKQSQIYLTWLMNDLNPDSGQNFQNQNVCSQITRELTPVVREALKVANKDELTERLCSSYNQIRVLFQQFQKSSRDIYKYLKIWYDNTLQDEKHRCRLWLKFLYTLKIQFMVSSNGQFKFPEVDATKTECFAATEMYEKELKPVIQKSTYPHPDSTIAPAQVATSVVLRSEKGLEIISIANEFQTKINEKANKLKQLQKQGKEPGWYKRTFKMLNEELDGVTLGYIVQSLVKQLQNCDVQEDKQLLRFLLSLNKLESVRKNREDVFDTHNFGEIDNGGDYDLERLDKVSLEKINC
jgi:hypothetical protein